MRILIIEDNPNLAAALKLAFEGAGHAADYLLDGEAGLKRIEMYSETYDLIVLDWMLPGKTGVEICKHIRERGIHTPVIMLTAKDTIDEKVFALNSGADDYLAKPFSPDELLARTRALWRRPRQALSPQLKAGRLILDPTTGKIFKDGKEIKLTLKEYRLLEYFMRNPNQLLDREKIFDHVWDFAASALSNVVDAHVYKLRRKIDPQHPEMAIETVKGAGYRLKA